MDSSFSMDKARIHCQTREEFGFSANILLRSNPLYEPRSENRGFIPEFDSYFWAKDRPDLSLSQKIFTVNVA